MPAGTTATVGMLFSDIEGSTRLLQQLGADYSAVLLEHHSLMRAAFKAHGGNEQSTEGDSFFVTFTVVSDAIAAALAAQRALATHPWPSDAPVRVRMGVHVGEIQTVAGTIVGMAVHEGARIGAAGHGGQVLVSALAAEMTGPLPNGATWRDLGEHRLKDIGAPVQLMQLDHAELPSQFPPPRTQGASRNNLPAQTSAFIGRDTEVAEINALLGTTRLLTLTGAGGAGKSRLALRTGADQGASFGDGVWFVDLAPLSDPADLPQQVAAALGLPETAAADLVGAIGHRRLLLLIDNCEHLVGAVSDMVDDLLRRCPNVAVLATSREPLGVHGETAWRVPSLVDVDAVNLFCTRARAVNPSFELTDANRSSVDDVCTRLDSIPLALELAAARLGSLSVEQLAGRLDQRFRLLAGGARTALARQRTLQATVDWSYDLLDQREQSVLRLLGVFTGGFTLEAVEAVCATDDVDVIDVLDYVDQLVAKSLVVAEERDGTVRYRLLETIRQYALDRMIQAGEAESARDAHLAWVRQLTSDVEAAVWFGIGGESRGLACLDADDANVRTAFDWALEGDRLHEAAVLIHQTFPWLFARGRSREGLHWCERLLATQANETDRAIAAFAEDLFSSNAGVNRSTEEQERMARDMEALPRSAYPWLAPPAAGYQTLYLVSRGEISAAEAVARCEAAVEGARGLNAVARGMTLQALAYAKANAGDLEGGRVSAIEAFNVMNEVDVSSGLCRGALTVAQIAVATNDLASAWAYGERCVEVARRTGDTGVVLAGTSLLATVRAMQDDLAGARDLMMGVLDAAEESRPDQDVAGVLNEIARYALLEGDITTADALAARAVALCESDSPSFAAVLYTAGEAARLSGDVDRAWKSFSQAVTVLAGEATGTSVVALGLLEGFAGLRLDVGDGVGAARLLAAATCLRPERGGPGLSAAIRHMSDLAERVSAALDPDAFAAAWDEGAALDIDAALALAAGMKPT